MRFLLASHPPALFACVRVCTVCRCVRVCTVCTCVCLLMWMFLQIACCCLLDVFIIFERSIGSCIPFSFSFLPSPLPLFFPHFLSFSLSPAPLPLPCYSVEFITCDGCIVLQNVVTLHLPLLPPVTDTPGRLHLPVPGW